MKGVVVGDDLDAALLRDGDIAIQVTHVKPDDRHPARESIEERTDGRLFELAGGENKQERGEKEEMRSSERLREEQRLPQDKHSQFEWG